MTSRITGLARLEPTIAIGLLTLGLSLAAAVVARLNCVSSQGEFDATCGLLESSRDEVALLPPPTGFSAVAFVRHHPWELAVAVVALVAIDRNDVTVRLLDEIVHGWHWLLGFASWLFQSAERCSRHSHGHGHGHGHGGPMPRPMPKRMAPLPPAMVRTLTRRERRQLDVFRRMATVDPFRALHDCLEVLSWQACRALFMRG